MTAPDLLEHPAALAGEPVAWASLRRILVVRPDNVGDVLMCGPLLRMVRAAAPAAALDVLASPAGAPAAALLDEVDDVVAAAVSWQQLGTGPVEDPDDAALVAALRTRGYDAAVVLTSFSQAPWPAAEVCRRAGIAVRAGLSKEFGGPVLTHWVPAPPDAWHQVDRARHLGARLGLPATDHRLRLTPQDAPDVLRGAPGPVVVILPGASCPSRRYAPDRLAAVARDLAADATVLVVGTAREHELVHAVAAGDARPLAGELDLAGLAGLLARADAVVANNSGGAHLADAVGTPVAVLFAGTEEPGQYAPRSVPAAVLRRPTTCTPCRQLRCPYDHECLDVAPATVAARVRDLLAGGHASGPSRSSA